MCEPPEGSSAEAATTEVGETGSTPPAPAARVGFALHRRTWRAMWWVAGVWSARLALQHWLRPTEGDELARHVVKGFAGLFIGVAAYALPLLILFYLGTWLWRGVFRRRSAALTITPEALERDYISFRRAVLLGLETCAALLIAAVLVIILGREVYEGWQRLRPRPVAAVQPEVVPEEAKAEWLSLIDRVTSDPDCVAEVKPRYWQLMRQYQQDTPGFIARCQASIPLALDYNELFWKDAGAALRTGRSHKSPDRKRLENTLLLDGIMSEDELAANDAMIAGLAAGEPVRIEQDPEAVLNEEYIQKMIALAPARRAALDELLTPPHDMDIE